MAIRFKLPTISLRKKTAATAVEVGSPLSPEAAKLGTEALTQLVDDKLKRISGDEFLVIKINRQGSLVLGGLLLTILWIAPLVEMGWGKFSSGEWSLRAIQNSIHISMPRLPAKNPNSSPSATPSAETPQPLPDATASALRVRMGTDSLEAATTIKNLLATSGFNQVDVVYDAHIDPMVVMIATHSGTVDLGQKLAQIFDGQYKMASASAILTEDSNFAATILVGKNALKKK